MGPTTSPIHRHRKEYSKASLFHVLLMEKMKLLIADQRETRRVSLAIVIIIVQIFFFSLKSSPLRTEKMFFHSDAHIEKIEFSSLASSFTDDNQITSFSSYCPRTSNCNHCNFHLFLLIRPHHLPIYPRPTNLFKIPTLN